MHLILSGGGSGEQTKETYDLYSSIIDKEKPVLYIPIAMPESEFEGCMNWITEELFSYGIFRIELLSDIFMLNAMNLDEYSSIFIGGGNTYNLLALLKQSKAFEILKDYMNNGGTIFGGSAGAIIMGDTIDSCSYDDENIVCLKDTSGFNMLNGYSICCHYDERDDNKIRSIRQIVSSCNKVIALPEETSLHIYNGSITVIGSNPCKVFVGNSIIKVEPLDRLNI